MLLRRGFGALDPCSPRHDLIPNGSGTSVAFNKQLLFVALTQAAKEGARFCMQAGNVSLY